MTGCGHACPNPVALKTSLDGLVIARGALKRSGPTGCWANGMPRNLSIPFTLVRPRNVPVLSLTSTVPVVGAAKTAVALHMVVKNPHIVSEAGMIMKIARSGILNERAMIRERAKLLYRWNYFFPFVRAELV